MRQANPTYGRAPVRSKLYQCWLDIRKRCLKPGHPDFVYYGARGISACFAGFEEFRDHVRRLPGLVRDAIIDRRDFNGHYAPGNLRWVDASTSGKNRRRKKRAEPGT